ARGGGVSVPGPEADVATRESQAAAPLEGHDERRVKSNETMTDRIGEDPIRRSGQRQVFQQEPNSWYSQVIPRPILGSSVGFLPSQRPIHQLFSEFNTLIFQQLYIRFQPSVQRKCNLPWPSEHLRILKRCFVHQRIATDRNVPFCYAKAFTVEVPRAV